MKRFALTLFLLFTVVFISACSLTEPVYKTVKFDVDGDITEVKVEIKSKVEKPEDPVKEGYIFEGWYLKDEEFDFDTKILKDITLVAKFEEDNSSEIDPIYYTVVFKDYDGKVLKTETVERGGAASAPANPTREGYSFTGWDKTFNNVTSSLEINAVYEAIIVNPVLFFTVTFKDYDGKVLKTEEVEQGKSATAPTSPTREGYTFKCWDKDFSNITNGLTVTAVYDKNEETPVMFNVIFKDYDGRTIKTEAVEKGKSATAPTNPSREGYTFKGWDKAFDNITSDLSVTATYDRITFTVTFKDYNGTVLKQETVNYNENATAPANPSRTGYTFTGWDKDYTKVKSNLEVTATYQENSADTTYAIVYNLGDGTWEALNKSEYIKLFLIDFYNFVNPTESLNESMYDSDNNYKG
nr:InlB B-repeat-containing protein [Bacilli bacterium]